MEFFSSNFRSNALSIACVLVLSLILGPSPDVEFGASKTTEEEILKIEPLVRLQQLGKISDSPHHLERTFLSEGSLQAGRLIQTWMEDAGMATWVDSIGNVHGRVAGCNESAQTLLLGSHLDTVIDAGMYDGALGIVAAIAAVKALHINGHLSKTVRPIEIIAFSDEEGVRFQSTFLGSSAVSGVFPLQLLHASDKRGVTVQSALRTAGLPGTVQSLQGLGYNRDSIWAYVELHIEQGPVLERKDVPLGVVGAIAGQTRLSVKLKGTQGHAGTVPMAIRRDPMTAAAEAIVSIEHICKHPGASLERSWEQVEEHLVSEGALVCTVGEITTWPGASNVIPGEVVFTVDIRAEDDDVRASIVSTIAQRIQQTCEDRHISWNIEVKHEASAVKCNSDIQKRLAKAATDALGKLADSMDLNADREAIPILVSGAGHDAMMMAHVTEIGMLFVRCTGGVSHSPAEQVLEDDVWAAGLVLQAFLNNEVVDSGADI